MFNGNMSYGRFLDSKQRNGMTWPNLVERRWWPVWGGFFFWLKWRYHVVTLWKIKHGNGKSWEIPYKWRFSWKIINGRFSSTPRLSTGGVYSTPFSIRPIPMVNPPFFQCESTIFWFRNSKAVAPEGSEEPGEARCCDVDDPQIYEILG